jgi:hypothetical protein
MSAEREKAFITRQLKKRQGVFASKRRSLQAGTPSTPVFNFLLMFKKVLILSASVGARHLRAADALEKAFNKLNAAAEVKNIDVLNYTNPLF